MNLIPKICVVTAMMRNRPSRLLTLTGTFILMHVRTALKYSESFFQLVTMAAKDGTGRKYILMPLNLMTSIQKPLKLAWGDCLLAEKNSKFNPAICLMWTCSSLLYYASDEAILYYTSDEAIPYYASDEANPEVCVCFMPVTWTKSHP